MNETPTDDTAAPAEVYVPALFNTLPLDAKLLRAVADQGYASMTPIQAKAIPIVLAGRDVMGARADRHWQDGRLLDPAAAEDAAP
jgi:ATP-dependent RNA helicase RhlE